MEKYEYKSVRVDFESGFMKSYEEGNNEILEKVDAILGKEGKAGWLLNATLPCSSNAFLTFVVLYFSRELDEAV